MEMSRPVRVQPPGELLGDRAGPGDVVAGDDVEEGPQEPAEAEPVVGIEVAVLPREQRVDEVLRDLVDGDGSRLCSPKNSVISRSLMSRIFVGRAGL